MEKDFGVKKVIVDMPEWDATKNKVKTLEAQVKTLSSGLPVVTLEHKSSWLGGSYTKVSYSGADDAMQQLVKEHNIMSDARRKALDTCELHRREVLALKERGWFRRLFNMKPKEKK